MAKRSKGAFKGYAGFAGNEATGARCMGIIRPGPCEIRFAFLAQEPPPSAAIAARPHESQPLASLV